MKGNAHYEFISIPDGHSFLWRMDDYPWRQSAWNYHPEFEIHSIRHTSGLAYVGDYIGNFDEGHLVLVGSNLTHNWITPIHNTKIIKNRDIVVQFDPDRIRRLMTELPEVSQLESLFARASYGIEFTGETAKMINDLLEKMGTKSGFSQLAGLFEILATMASSNECRTLATPQFVRDFQPSTSNELQLMETVLDYIRNHYLKKIKVSDVAGLVGMSDNAFSKFFKAHTGNSFTDHVIQLRMWTACKMLTESATPITELCFDCGYQNISIFNRTFLKCIGMTPSKYRATAGNASTRIQEITSTGATRI